MSEAVAESLTNEEKNTLWHDTRKEMIAHGILRAQDTFARIAGRKEAELQRDYIAGRVLTLELMKEAQASAGKTLGQYAFYRCASGNSLVASSTPDNPMGNSEGVPWDSPDGMIQNIYDQMLKELQNVEPEQSQDVETRISGQ